MFYYFLEIFMITIGNVNWYFLQNKFNIFIKFSFGSVKLKIIVIFFFYFNNQMQ